MSVMNAARQEGEPNDFQLLLKKAVLKILRETGSRPATMDTDLNPSNLGTREYWEETYSTDLQNYEDTNGVDVGEIWLITLEKGGYTDLTGIDFSQGAVTLASKVASDKGSRAKHYCADITLPECNHRDLPEIFGRTFDVCIDKGTYDAICLSPEESKEKRLAYMKNISKISSPEGILIITSCNWTKDELLAQFTDFDLLIELPAPQFQFGGKKGSTVTALVFKHKV